MGGEHSTIEEQREASMREQPQPRKRREPTFDATVLAEVDALHQRFDADRTGRLDASQVRRFISDMHALDLINGVDDSKVLRTRKIVARHAPKLVDLSEVEAVTGAAWRLYFRRVFAELDAAAEQIARADATASRHRAMSTGHQLFLQALRHSGADGAAEWGRSALVVSDDDGPRLPPRRSATTAAAAATLPSAAHAAPLGERAPHDPIAQVRVLLCTVTFHANLAHSLTRSP
jgi:hypothetical protein